MSNIVININMRKLKKLLIILIITIICSSSFVFATEGEEENPKGGNETAETEEKTEEKTEEQKQEEEKQEEQKQEEPKVEEPKEEATKEETPKEEAPTENVQENNEQEEIGETPKQTEKTTKTENTNSNTQDQPTVKSSNADLSNLGITPYDFSGFKSDKTSYNVAVPNSVKNVDVYAKAKDGGATVKGTGKLELKEGQNTATVEVTAEDGTKKTYTINIKRLKEGETLENNSSGESLKLKDIKIEGIALEPQFSAENHKYLVNYEGDLTFFNITAESGNSSDMVQILGNENLIDGENKVLILVSDTSEQNVGIYELTIRKNYEKAKAIQKEKETKEMWDNIFKWGFRILAFVAIFGVMAIIIIRHKKLQIVEDESELPKSLRKNKVSSTTQNNASTNKKTKISDKKKKNNSGKHGK